jgi:flagellar basal body-associated protein FliL
MRPGFAVPRGPTALATTHVIARRRERGWVVILAAAIVVLVVAIAVILVTRGSSVAPRPPVDDGPTIVRMHHVPAPVPAASDSAAPAAPSTP